jgi:hypothetical protein
MPLNVPNLDDRTYGDLVEEALAMLPRYAPSWTNHNPSDPGITVIELLAYFAELYIYRLNRVTRETRLRFLQLMAGVDRHRASEWAALSTEEIARGLRQAVRDLRRLQRAVTTEDYERLAREATADGPPASPVVRAKAFPRQNLELTVPGGRDREAPGHLSVIAVPPDGAPRGAVVTMLSRVRDHLESSRMLAIRLHIVEPFLLWVLVTARIHLRVDVSDELRARAREDALKTLQEFGSPMVGGGPQGEGWPFGRALYTSEVYERLEQLDGVDYVDDVDVVRLSMREEVSDERARIGYKVGRSILGVDAWLGTRPEHGPDRVLVDESGRLIGIALRPYELVRITSTVDDFVIGEGAPARGPRAGRTRRAAAATAVTAEGPGHLGTGAAHVGEPARPSESIVRRPAGREQPRRTEGTPGRLLAQLPGVYHASPDLAQLLSVFETILCQPHERALEAQIAEIATLLDVVRAPHELPGWTSNEAPGALSERRDAFLPWLTQWVALSGAASLSVEQQRRLLGQIVPLYACRGTRRYVTKLLSFYLPEQTEIQIEDQEFTGLILGKSKIGVDAWLEQDRPFWFKVTIRIPDTGSSGEPRARGRIDWPTRIRQVVDLAKPAHTTYDLEVAPTASGVIGGGR